MNFGALIDWAAARAFVKKRIYSLGLAGAYIAWGVWLFLFVRNFRDIFSDFHVLLPLPMRTQMAIGPYGCLFLATAIGTSLILNEWRFRKRFVSLLLTLALLFWIGYVAEVAFTASMRGTHQIH